MIRYRSSLAFGLNISSADFSEGSQEVAVKVKAMKQLRVYGQGKFHPTTLWRVVLWFYWGLMISHGYCSMGTWLRKTPKQCRTMRIYTV